MECLFHAVESGKQPKENENESVRVRVRDEVLSGCVCARLDMKTEKTNTNAVWKDVITNFPHAPYQLLSNAYHNNTEHRAYTHSRTKIQNEWMKTMVFAQAHMCVWVSEFVNKH